VMPVVGFVHAYGGWYVTISRGEHPITMISTKDRGAAEELAANLRGALADAFHYGYNESAALVAV